MKLRWHKQVQLVRITYGYEVFPSPINQREECRNEASPETVLYALMTLKVFVLWCLTIFIAVTAQTGPHIASDCKQPCPEALFSISGAHQCLESALQMLSWIQQPWRWLSRYIYWRKSWYLRWPPSTLCVSSGWSVGPQYEVEEARVLSFLWAWRPRFLGEQTLGLGWSSMLQYDPGLG